MHNYYFHMVGVGFKVYKNLIKSVSVAEHSLYVIWNDDECTEVLRIRETKKNSMCDPPEY